MCSGLGGDKGSEQYRYRERNVLGEEVAKHLKGNNTVWKQNGKIWEEKRSTHTEKVHGD